MVSVTTFQLCRSSQKAAIDDVETNKQGCVPGKPDAHKQVGQDVAHGLSLPPAAAQTRTPPRPRQGPNILLLPSWLPPFHHNGLQEAPGMFQASSCLRKCVLCSLCPWSFPPADPSLPSTLFKSYLLGVAVIAQRDWRPLWSTGSQVQSF